MRGGKQERYDLAVPFRFRFALIAGKTPALRFC